MPMQTTMNIGIRPVDRPQVPGSTEGVSRKGDGGSSSAFSPRTHVAIQTAVDDMAGILSKISQHQDDTIEKMPEDLQKVVQNVLKQAFSMNETLSRGIGSTLESQRFSMEQLTALSRMLHQLGNLVEKGFSTDFGDDLSALLKNFKNFMLETEGSSLEPVLLNKAAFELLDTKTLEELPDALKALIAASGSVSVQPQVQTGEGSSLGFLKQLVQFFMPKPQNQGGNAQSGTNAGTNANNANNPQTNFNNANANANAQGNTAANTGNNANAGGQFANTQNNANNANANSFANNSGQPANTGNANNANANNMQNANTSAGSGGQNANNANNANANNMQNPQNANTNPNTGGQATNNANANANANTQQNANAWNGGQNAGNANANNSGQPASNANNANANNFANNNGQPSNNTNANNASNSNANFSGQNTGNTNANSQANANANQNFNNAQNNQSSQNNQSTFTGGNNNGEYVPNLKENLQNRYIKPNANGTPAPPTEAQQARVQLSRVPIQNTPQAMETMKGMAELLLKNNPKMTEADVQLLQNFVNGREPVMDTREVRQLQTLLRLCQQNVPTTLQQAAVQQDLPDLPRLWAFMTLCDLSVAKRMTGRQLKKAGKDVADLVLSMRHSMSGANREVQGQRSLNFMMPLYMEGEEKSYPSYIHVYDENEPDPYTGEMKKETWLRLCVLTDNIGAVELTFRIYGDNELDMRLFFSSHETAEEFRDAIPDFIGSLGATQELMLNEIKVGAVDERRFL